jgi:hypothetical protein
MGFCTHGSLLILKQIYARVQASKVKIKKSIKSREFVHTGTFKNNIFFLSRGKYYSIAAIEIRRNDEAKLEIMPTMAPVSPPKASAPTFRKAEEINIILQVEGQP